MCHQRPFAEAARSDRGVAVATLAARALARTAADVLADASLREEARRCFEAGREE